MRNSIHTYFQPGIIHFMAYPQTMRGEGPVLETLKNILTDDYFDAVEITHIANPTIRAQAQQLLRQSHMTACFGAQPQLLSSGLNPNALDEADRLACEKHLLTLLDEAEFLGCSGMGFLSGKWEASQREAHYAQLCKTTVSLCRAAQSKGMQIELEVFDYDLDKRSLIGPAAYAARFAAEIRSQFQNFGLIVDLSHIPQTHEKSLYVLRTLRSYITHLHIGSAVTVPGAEAFGDTHPRFGFPNGANDTAELVEFLRACQVEGLFCKEDPLVLSFEVKPWKEEDPSIVIANAKRVLNRAWSLLEETV